MNESVVDLKWYLGGFRHPLSKKGLRGLPKVQRLLLKQTLLIANDDLALLWTILAGSVFLR